MGIKWPKSKKHRKKNCSVWYPILSGQSYHRKNISCVIITYLEFTNYRQQLSRLVSVTWSHIQESACTRSKDLGPVQKWCFCRDKSSAETASESNFLIKFDITHRATWLWHDSDSDVVSLSCQTKFINYTNVFRRNFGVPAESASVNTEFRSTLARHLIQSRASAVLWSNLNCN